MTCPVCGKEVPGTVAICWPVEPVVVLPGYVYLLDDSPNPGDENDHQKQEEK